MDKPCIYYIPPVFPAVFPNIHVGHARMSDMGQTQALPSESNQAGGEGTLIISRLSWGSGCPEEGGSKPTCRTRQNFPRESGGSRVALVLGMHRKDQPGEDILQAPTKALQGKVKPIPTPCCPKCSKGGTEFCPYLDTSSLNLFQHPSFFALQDPSLP